MTHDLVLPARKVIPAPDGAIRFNLTLPVLRIGFGPFSIDPVEQFIGAKLTDILESLLTGPVFRRPSVAGPAIEVYPLALPEGEGASVPLVSRPDPPGTAKGGSSRFRWHGEITSAGG